MEPRSGAPCAGHLLPEHLQQQPSHDASCRVDSQDLDTQLAAAGELKLRGEIHLSLPNAWIGGGGFLCRGGCKAQWRHDMVCHPVNYRLIQREASLAMLLGLPLDSVRRDLYPRLGDAMA